MVERLPLLDARRVPRLAFAPRLDPRLHRELARLDDPAVPYAETFRALAAYARRHRIFRPSYEHVRRLLQELRRIRPARWVPRRSTAHLLFEAAYGLGAPGEPRAGLARAAPVHPP